jgi:hypothetical protein
MGDHPDPRNSIYGGSRVGDLMQMRALHLHVELVMIREGCADNRSLNFHSRQKDEGNRSARSLFKKKAVADGITLQLLV